MSINGIQPTSTPNKVLTTSATTAQTTTPPTTVQASSTSSTSTKVADLCDSGDDKQAVYAQQLSRWMIKSPGAMLFMGKNSFMRSVTSFLTGVPKDTLKEFAYRADLMRVPGMSADMVKVIRNPLVVQMSDIKGPGDLGRSGLADIVSFVRLIGLGKDLGEVSSVIEKARTMENTVS